MPKPLAEIDTARLEARIPVQVYDQMQRAARLRGMTLTGYLIASNETERLNGKYSAYGTATLKSTALTKYGGN